MSDVRNVHCCAICGRVAFRCHGSKREPHNHAPQYLERCEKHRGMRAAIHGGHRSPSVNEASLAPFRDCPYDHEAAGVVLSGSCFKPECVSRAVRGALFCVDHLHEAGFTDEKILKIVRGEDHVERVPCIHCNGTGKVVR